MPSGNCCRCSKICSAAPAAAEIVADDGVKYVAAIGAVRSAVADDLLDLIDVVAGPPPLKPLPLTACCSRCRGSRLAALAPDHRPVDHLVDDW